MAGPSVHGKIRLRESLGLSNNKINRIYKRPGPELYLQAGGLILSRRSLNGPLRPIRGKEQRREAHIENHGGFRRGFPSLDPSTALVGPGLRPGSWRRVQCVERRTGMRSRGDAGFCGTTATHMEEARP